MSDRIFLGICAGCLGEAKDHSLETLSNGLVTAGLFSVVSLHTPECFNACGLPATVTLQSKGRATYIFRDVVIVRDISDIIKTIEAYIAAPLGWIEDARVCGHLRTCLTARLPAIDL